MFEKIDQLLSIKQLRSHHNQGILICSATQSEGIDFVKEILNALCDKKTALFLSGGRTPRDLYSVLAKDETLNVGAVAMIDERYGEKFHPKSNETMMRDVGLLRYLQMRDIPFYPILQGNENTDSGQGQNDKRRENTALQYDEQLRSLFAVYQKSIGVLGIGIDGHTAGLPADLTIWREQLEHSEKHRYVVSYDDTNGFYKERVTMTFLGLLMLDLLIVLVFGNDKKAALEQMFGEGKEEEMPSRFFKRPEIAGKTLLITDQNV